MKKYISNEEISNNLGSNEKIWEQIFSKKEWGKYPSENVIRFIARNFYNVQDRSKINILELGFGTGANLWFCAKE
ncbi:SAM-dependent methyltransferase, partial [Campylobacter jejuni]|nr:SAM-dependent methyltransferase [Campylobacter jejuni]